MSQQAFLSKLVQKLEAAGIPYMIAGSLGSSFHGEPRATNDIDLIVSPAAEQLAAFLAALGDGYYVSPELAAEALRQRSMFNVIDFEEGWKADFVIRKERPFSVEEFGPRRAVSLMGIPAWVVSPEDAIPSKLEWDKTTPSERQLQDAAGVAAV